MTTPVASVPGPSHCGDSVCADAVLRSLHDVFSELPDPRRFNRRHSLPALLSALIVAFLCDNNAMSHVVYYLRNNEAVRRQVGLVHHTSPSQSTYKRLFDKLSFEDLRKAISDWLGKLALMRIAARRHGELAVAIDGKTARGTGEHSIYVFMHDFWQLLDMFEAGEKTNEFSALETQLEGIINKYPFLTIFTMDALHAQHSLAKTLTAQGKRAIFQIKGNQKETLKRLQRMFAPMKAQSPDAETVEKNRRLYLHASSVGS